MSYVVDPRFPKFEVNGLRYALTYQDDFGEIVLLEWNGTNYVGWGGTADQSSVISIVSDVEIMKPRVIDGVEEPGSLHTFMRWVIQEAKRRAALRANLPLPDPNNRIERCKYALLQLVSDGDLALPPPPLP